MYKKHFFYEYILVWKFRKEKSVKIITLYRKLLKVYNKDRFWFKITTLNVEENMLVFYRSILNMEYIVEKGTWIIQ